MSISTNIQTINAKNTISPKANTTFRAKSVHVEDYPPDTVEINGKKKTGDVYPKKWTKNSFLEF